MPAKQRTLIAVTFMVTGLVALVLAEIVLRLFGPAPTLVYKPNAYYGWGYTPGDEFTWTTEGREIPIEINQLGLRDREHAYAKPAGVSRILVLGDSFQEALQVELDSSFSKVLERELNAGARGGRVEVLNAGMSGFGTDNALLYYTHEGQKYESDVVLLSFYIGNDVRNNWHKLEALDVGGSRKPYFDLGTNGLELREYPFIEHESLGTRMRIFLNRHIRLYSFARDLRDRLRTPNTPMPSDGSGHVSVPLDLQLFETEPSTEWENAWQVTDGLLRKLKLEVETRGAELLVVVVPTAFQVHSEIWDERLSGLSGLDGVAWSLDGPNERLDGMLAKAGIRYVDLLSSLRETARESGTKLYFTSDNHWNEEGHRYAALRVVEVISNESNSIVR